MKPLTILNVAYPLARVGSDSVGGAEQVVAQLDEGLMKAGHRSLVIASEGSLTAGRLMPTPPWTGELDRQTQEKAAEVHARTIRRALDSWQVDAIHLHGVDFFGSL